LFAFDSQEWIEDATEADLSYRKKRKLLADGAD